jgi:hypothetical protein
VLLRPVKVVLSPVTVLFKPATVVPSVVAVFCTVLRLVLMVLRLLARFVTWLIAMGRVAYCVEPDPPLVVVPPVLVPSVLVSRTCASDNAVVLGGTCHVSVQETVPSLLV